MRSSNREPAASSFAGELAERQLVRPGQRDVIRAVELRLDEGELAVFSTPAHDPVFWAKLSPSEQAIAGLILGGHGDRDIACVRGCSPRTITKQIDDLFDRLGVRTRAQLAQRLIPLFPDR